MKEIAIILLAAGSSSRMGKSKQLLLVGGKSLLTKSAEAALDARPEKIIVVLGSGESAHRDVLKGLPVDVIYNPDWQKGMGTSLKAGLARAQELIPDLKAIVIAVCDQPMLKGNHLKNLIDKFRSTGGSVVASSYAGTSGVPALFDRSLFPKLSALHDAQGAKTVLMETPGVAIPFPEGAIDLDTPSDYEKFIKGEE